MLLEIKVAKAAHTWTIDVEKLPKASLEYVIEYGIRQCINDPVAGVKSGDYATVEAFNAAAFEKAQSRVDQLESGNVPGSRAPADPKAATVRKLARELESKGVDMGALAQVDIGKLAAWLEKQAHQGRAA